MINGLNFPYDDFDLGELNVLGCHLLIIIVLHLFSVHCKPHLASGSDFRVACLLNI